MPETSSNVVILASLRRRKLHDVPATARLVLDRLGRDPVFAPDRRKHVYAYLQDDWPRLDPFDWHATPAIALPVLQGGPGASLRFTVGFQSTSVDLELNCGGEAAPGTPAGNRQKAAVATDGSTTILGVEDAQSRDSLLCRHFLALTADLFATLQCDYGWVRHAAVQHGNAFDRVRRGFLEPSFIAWANFFGPELVAQLGLGQLLSAPAHSVQELPGGSVLLTVAASPVQELDADAQVTIARVQAHLGIRSPSERATPQEVAAFNARLAARLAEMREHTKSRYRSKRDETAAEMRHQAEGCVRSAARFWGAALDFGPASIATVDQIISTEFTASVTEDAFATAEQGFGAYLGEVVRRNYGGQWRDGQRKGQPILVRVGPSRKRLDPFAAVRRRFREPTTGQGLSLDALRYRLLHPWEPAGFTLARWLESQCKVRPPKKAPAKPPVDQLSAAEIRRAAVKAEV